MGFYLPNDDTCHLRDPDWLQHVSRRPAMGGYRSIALCFDVDPKLTGSVVLTAD
jgi:hypothetical protein